MRAFWSRPRSGRVSAEARQGCVFPDPSVDRVAGSGRHVWNSFGDTRGVYPVLPRVGLEPTVTDRVAGMYCPQVNNEKKRLKRKRQGPDPLPGNWG